MERYRRNSGKSNSRTHALEGLTRSSNQSIVSDVSSIDEVEYIGEPQLIGIVGDEDTCVGFLLGTIWLSPIINAGIGQVNEDLSQNFIVVGPKMDDFQLELMFLDMLERPDVGLILITKEAAEKIAHVISMHSGINPTLMIIPGHNGPFEFDLPLAVKDIEDRRQATFATAEGSRRGSVLSTTSVKTVESHAALLSRKVSTHSLRSVLSTRSIKM